MSTTHRGNLLNEVTFEEHDGTNNAKRVNIVASNATIFAVVNTGAAGDSVANIGFATVSVSNPTLYAVVNTGAAGSGNVTLDPGSRTGIVGNITLSDSKGFIGLATTVNAASPAFIGIVTIANTNIRAIAGNVTLSDSKTFIGLTTTVNAASPAFIGIVTIANTNIRAIAGNVTLSDSKGFIGLVTAQAVNVGTSKTLITKNLAFAQASIVTIAVPSNTFKITNLLLNSNATTRINIKSGATYLTGNVSLGITLFPGGGWVESGSPDSPVYLGLAAASAIVIEKFDLTATSAQIGGKLIYFDE